jgi:hypothetical protein
MVVLPPLSPDARKVLVQHDKDVLRVFTAYALTFASQYGAQLEPDYELPLSKQSFLGSSSDDDSLFRRHLRNTAIPVIARSSFVANSGHGDVFRSVEELTGTVRRGLDLNEHAIPSLERIVAVPDKEGAMPFALNAYLLDFYTHGQVAALAVANGIRRGDVWYLLQDFMLTLMTVRTSLEQLLLKASQEAEANAASVDDEDALDVDSGYGSFEPGEMDDDGELGSGETNFKRPGGVVDRDWRVYEVVNAATREFEEKYKAMWA